jgi:hypothetical protein
MSEKFRCAAVQLIAYWIGGHIILAQGRPKCRLKARLKAASGNKLQALVSQVLHQRLVKEMVKAFAKAGARHTDLSRQFLNARVIQGIGVQVFQASTGDWVVKSCKPANLVRRQTLHMVV